MRVLDLKSGFAAFLTIIIVSAAALILAISASSLVISDNQMALIHNIEEELLSGIDGCTEEALFQLRLNFDWAGGDTSIGDISCIINVAPSGENRRLRIKADISHGFGDYYKEIEIVSYRYNGKLIIDSWREVSG